MSSAPGDQSALVLHGGPAVATMEKLFAEYRKDFIAYSTGAMKKLNDVEKSVTVSALNFPLRFCRFSFFLHVVAC
jgi:hypothetical protein